MIREFMMEEVREQFLETVRSYISYWNTLPNKTIQERLEGLAFSILVILDGDTSSLPNFIVAPNPHPDDKKYFQNNKENWFPENCIPAINCNISGCLHEIFYKVKP